MTISASELTAAQTVPCTDIWASSPELLITGRHIITTPDQALHAYPGVRFAVTTDADAISAELTDMPEQAEDGTLHSNTFAIVIDGKVQSKLILLKGRHIYRIAGNLDQGQHTVALVKLTESLVGQSIFHRFILSGETIVQRPDPLARTIEFIGDSITCGYGIESNDGSDSFRSLTENAYKAYAMQAARLLGAEPMLVSYSGRGIYRNWGDTEYYHDTMLELYPRTTPQRSDLAWDAANNRPDAVVVCLGTNDFSPPLGAEQSIFIVRYLKFLKTIRSNYGGAVPIVCINGPMLSSEERSQVETWIGACLSELADPNIRYLAFSPCLPQDGWAADFHPSQKTADRNASELAEFLVNTLKW